MDLRITNSVFLHVLGSIYEIGTGKSYTQRVLIPKVVSVLKGAKRYPTEAETEQLNSHALRSI